MKLEPIINPHARIWQVTKKSKAEEKDELIEATKKTAIEKYGVSNHISIGHCQSHARAVTEMSPQSI